MWLGFCWREVVPSPKLHRYAGRVLPHPPGVAVAWKLVALPAAVLAGTVAVQARPHPAVTTTLAVAEHMGPPVAPSVTRSTGLYVPGVEYVWVVLGVVAVLIRRPATSRS